VKELCGRLAVQLAGRDLTPTLPGGQARVLFTYLTVNRALPAGRDRLLRSGSAAASSRPGGAARASWS
jgi:hypothetical protein